MLVLAVLQALMYGKLGIWRGMKIAIAVRCSDIYRRDECFDSAEEVLLDIAIEKKSEHVGTRKVHLNFQMPGMTEELR
jgi:hypothetical protein